MADTYRMQLPVTREMWQAHAERACGKIVLSPHQAQARDQDQTQDGMEAVCDQCHGCHRANTCPIEATVYGFWRDVELQHVELLAQGAAATAAAAALLTLRVFDMSTKTTSTVHCGALCLDRVAMSHTVWRDHMWILTPLAPLVVPHAGTGTSASTGAESVEAVARDTEYFRQHHTQLRQDLIGVCAAAEPLLHDAKDDSLFLDESMAPEPREHYPLPMLGGDHRACAVLTHRLTCGYEGRSCEDLLCGAARGRLALFFQDHTTASAAWEDLSVQQTSLATLRSTCPDGLLHPGYSATTPCCVLVDMRGSMMTWTLAMPPSGDTTDGAPRSWVLVEDE